MPRVHRTIISTLCRAISPCSLPESSRNTLSTPADFVRDQIVDTSYYCLQSCNKSSGRVGNQTLKHDMYHLAVGICARRIENRADVLKITAVRKSLFEIRGLARLRIPLSAQITPMRNKRRRRRRSSTCERAPGERRWFGFRRNRRGGGGRVIIKRFIRLLSRSYSALSVRVVSPRFFFLSPSFPLSPVPAFLSSL